MRIKRILLLATSCMLFLPSFLVGAAENTSSAEETKAKADGVVATKDEVVYATLDASGQLDEAYVVNVLDVSKEGTVVDYGTYSSLKNLTDLSKLEQDDNKVRIKAPKGKFYYQGTLKDGSKLPWDITISYLLDGKKVSPKELAGKEGHIEIGIQTAASENVGKAFFENYILQVSLTLDPDIYSNIEAPGGMIANVGKNKQITFTVMPEKEGDLRVQADVVDFELNGVEIAAVPSTIAIDAPDTKSMTKDMETLTDAIGEVNNGVSALNNGVSGLNNGVGSLRNGSKQYQNGISELGRASSGLITASGSIHEGLSTMSKSLSESLSQTDLSDVQELPDGLTQLSENLYKVANGLLLLQENYAEVYSVLDGVMTEIPEYDITEEEIQGLYMSGADSEVLDKLVETYTTARTAKGTYSAVKEGFDAIDAALVETSGGLTKMGDALVGTADQISASLEEMDIENSLAQLQQGLDTLSTNYGKFHSGLIGYTEGVAKLSNSYNELHSGIVELSSGTAELENGVAELHDGTNTLYKETSDLPNQMQEEIDKMISEFDKSDFEAVSFISSDNENVNTVQFVIKTEGIKKEEPKTDPEIVEEEKGFWSRFMDLFRKE